MTRKIHRAIACAAIVILAAAAQPQERGMVQWPFYGGDQGGMKYSRLTDINPGNVSRLGIAWTWKTGEAPLEKYGTRPGMFEVTPLMIDDVLYLSTPYNKVVALKAGTGEILWSYDPKAYEMGQPANGTGYVHRGVAAWRDGGKLRIFMNSRYRLICLDAVTGRPVDSFGEQGVVDLSQGLVWPINKLHYTETSPPVVYGDVVIVGNGVGDRLVYRNDPPGDVRGFDAHTGKQLWSFHTIPQAGEFGNDTWGKDAWRFTGHTNVWAPMTLDEQRGLVYLPVSTPSNDFYGGSRPGNNLYGETLVCLDAATGKQKWHFQIVHHGLWDYDLAAPPTLTTITVHGRKIDAVAQETKEGFVFVFDRVTGKPVWPIEERPVLASDIESEHASPTQPFPTKPPAISRQGITLDDAFDATPELKAEAQAQMQQYRIGPLFTPPSFRGTLMLPGVLGGANWGGGAFDPETGLLYVKTTNLAHIARVKRPDRTQNNPRASEVDADWSGDLQGTNATFHDGLPLTKPPYGELVAVDLNHGTIRWKIPLGDWPELRSNPVLRGVTLPPVLGTAGPQGPVVTKGGLLFVSGGDGALHAINKVNGDDLWQGKLPARSHGTPITYRTREGRQFVVIATGAGADASLVAFSLRAGRAAVETSIGK
ncbi:MAG TPA: pyrroloquinoline quinone-dependent dehydrogenase [Acidobacteriaceae bacterium]|nr:pyrroloquinoline quinone-dependent dehydrogenase [Acidobacteriaceae bacterium]